MDIKAAPTLPSVPRSDLDAVVGGYHSDPFSILGPHDLGAAHVVRAFLPGAQEVTLIHRHNGVELCSLVQVGTSGFFEGAPRETTDYRLCVLWASGQREQFDDPYSFGLLLSEFDLHLIAEGSHRELARCLGAQAMDIDGVVGVRFALWAPNAQRVSVVGDFNLWDERRHPMRLRHSAGVWELFIPQLAVGARYKYSLIGAHGERLPQKADPLARATEAPPATASVVADAASFSWTDWAWQKKRADTEMATQPLSIYELHVGSWLREVNDVQNGWTVLADRIIPYATTMGFTHLELMPIMEYPFGGSWGYQPISLFAPSARFGSPDLFASFVDRCHSANLGVILDWVPGHFPDDVHGLAQFDGTALYEYADRREGFHADWNTYIYNFGRHEVRGFLIASALEWLERFHIDGLRVDAVAAMLYRDYSRAPGQWVPNRYGGRENLEAVEFLRELNRVVAERCPGTLTIAEESTAWPGVTAPQAAGGLGFSFKWNMGWMHDTLRYMTHDPIHRAWHHDDLTFGLVYAYSERFVLPLSHDEVVYGKRSLINKMPGDLWQRFANLRAYYAFMWSHPGKKLIFMGAEIAQSREWNHDAELDWDLVDDPFHAGVQRLVADLNRLLRSEPALYAQDDRSEGFQWLVGDDRGNSVFAFMRRAQPDPAQDPGILIVSNFTPMPRYGYRIGVPCGGNWIERLNSDATIYAGSNVGNKGMLFAHPQEAHGQPFSLVMTLPPLATLIFSPSP